MAHINYKIDYTVEVFVVHRHRVLLRKHDKYGIWLSVGGHIDLGEDLNEAAIREVQEEVGLEATLYGPTGVPLHAGNPGRDLIPPRYVNRHPINEHHEHVTFVYFAIANSDQLTLCEKEKSLECKWFSLRELEDEIYDMQPRIRHYAKKSLEKLWIDKPASNR